MHSHQHTDSCWRGRVRAYGELAARAKRLDIAERNVLTTVRRNNVSMTAEEYGAFAAAYRSRRPLNDRRTRPIRAAVTSA